MCARKRVDLECSRLSRRHLPDVGFVHFYFEAHALQVFREHEEHRRVERCRHRLAGIDLPRQHDTGDRRTNHCFRGLCLVGRKLRTGLRDRGGRRIDGRQRAGMLGAGIVELCRRGHLAARELPDFLEPCERCLCLLRGRLGLRDSGLCRLQAARLCAIASCSRDVSSRASTSPLCTASLLSTFTSVTRPESSEPTSTLFVGCRFPVADTVTRRSPRCTGAVA
jgi:hypothetical protein